MQKIKEGTKSIADEHKEVTIVFCDIFDFHDICTMYTPKELIQLLNEVQLSFDRLCETHNVQKIETVGKTYMACGGLNYDIEENEKQLNLHAQNALQLALAMMKRVESITLKSKQSLQIKIGIHTGPVVAGVVGDHKPQFALVGDTVNTASRMCSNVRNPMCIRITEATYEKVKGMPNFYFHAEQIEIKGKGLMNTFLVFQNEENLKSFFFQQSKVKSKANKEPDSEVVQKKFQRRNSFRDQRNFTKLCLERNADSDTINCLNSPLKKKKKSVSQRTITEEDQSNLTKEYESFQQTQDQSEKISKLHSESSANLLSQEIQTQDNKFQISLNNLQTQENETNPLIIKDDNEQQKTQENALTENQQNQSTNQNHKKPPIIQKPGKSKLNKVITSKNLNPLDINNQNMTKVDQYPSKLKKQSNFLDKEEVQSAQLPTKIFYQAQEMLQNNVVQSTNTSPAKSPFLQTSEQTTEQTQPTEQVMLFQTQVEENFNIASNCLSNANFNSQNESKKEDNIKNDIQMNPTRQFPSEGRLQFSNKRRKSFTNRRLDTTFNDIINQDQNKNEKKSFKTIFKNILRKIYDILKQNRSQSFQSKLFENEVIVQTTQRDNFCLSGVVTSLLFQVLFMILFYSNKYFEFKEYKEIIIVSSIFIFLHLVSIFFWYMKSKYQDLLITFTYVGCTIIMICYSEVIEIMIGFIVCFYMILIAYGTKQRLIYLLIIFIGIFITEQVLFHYYLQSNESYFIILEQSLFTKTLLLFTVFSNENSVITSNKIQSLAQVEIQRAEILLRHLMPLHVLKQIKKGQTVAELIENISIIYADIVGFTSFSSGKKPQEIIQVLSQLFSKFDKLCANFKCYKVCTIGDCYVAIGYNGEIEKENRKPVEELNNLMLFAFKLIEAIEETNQECQSSLQMRIGIHIGKLIGGISGSNIVRYDIYGSDVMMANRMESEGKPGYVNISEKTKNLLEQNQLPYSYQFNKSIKIQKKKKQVLKVKDIKCFFTFKEPKSAKLIENRNELQK